MDKKSLYLCQNWSELLKLTEIKRELPSVKASLSVLEKIYEKFEKSCLDQDEELAYVYIIRYLSIYSDMIKSFKKDLNYINDIINPKKVQLAFEKAERIRESLKERYAISCEKNTEIVAEPLKVVESCTKGSITAVDLYNRLKKNENILIVDARSADEYLNCRINYSQLVNIPAKELKPGCSIMDVNKLLEVSNSKHELEVWNKRQLASFVLIVIWEKEDLESANLVKDAIFKWDAECSIKEPIILEGGLYSFLNYYPTMVTNAKYKGPANVNSDDIFLSDDIKYPDFDIIEAEKKRKKDLEKLKEKKCSENRNEVNENSKKITPKTKKTKDLNISVDRTLKPNISINDPVTDIKSNLVVDRSLKPLKVHDPNNGDILASKTGTSSKLSKHESIVSANFESEDLHNDKSFNSLDRSLKPNILRDLNVDKVQPIIPDKKEPDSNEINTVNTSLSEVSRLSNNSRTNQDRTNFTAKGGAKSIPPPTPTATVETKPSNLPSWIVQVYDDKRQEHFYLDRKNNKRFRVLPEEYLHSDKENTVQPDHITSLKDHSVDKKSILKPSSLKRSTSQPNLSEDVSSTNNQGFRNDVISHSSKQSDPPILNREFKPSNSKPFIDFPASRLSNFNPNYKNVTPGLTGLRNMGNTCYMNSVIQALSNTKFLTNYILTDNYQHDINRDNPLGYGGEIVTEYAYLTTALWTGNYREVSPIDFKHIIDCKNEMFRGGEQHDSQEFLLFLLDGLHEDLNSGCKDMKKSVPPIDECKNDCDRASKSWDAHIAVNDSVIVKLFQGQYRSKVTCDYCQMVSVTFDAFMYLSLPLVPNHNRCTLEDCLKLFLAEERMTGASQWFCPKCKTNRNAKKKIDIWKLPPYLLIHLKRFSCTGQYRQKLNTFVDFPMQSLSLVNILEHTKQSQKHETYHLYAVSNHHGNMESGHYTSFCKSWKENDWYNYDDDVVTKIRDSDVKTPSAYILFYESYNIKQAGFKT